MLGTKNTKINKKNNLCIQEDGLILSDMYTGRKE